MDNPNPITLAEQGKQEYEKGKFAAAADLFSKAAQAYENSQDALNAAEMKNNQSVALLQAGKPKEALQVTDGTEEIFEQVNDLKRQGVAVGNRAAALEGLKKWDEALVEYDRAAKILEQAGEGSVSELPCAFSARENHKKTGHFPLLRKRGVWIQFERTRNRHC